ncbi:hypothetical protein FACS1894125_1370 [Actinomycetota bacterium]|nr:hypothetical protein FACS1894125_1370 [Actinomycetota bacterium]
MDKFDIELPDWSYRREHIESRSLRKSRDTDILVTWANEAYLDVDAVTLNPDPAAESGLSVRTIGFSDGAGFLITVITVLSEGIIWGASAWKSNAKDVDLYNKNKEVRND